MSRVQRRVGRHDGARVGVFGGTFDPPHVAHLMVAEVAREQLGLDTVLFVPAGVPPHKADSVTASAADRLGMTGAAIQGFAAFAVDDREV
ncbi:MAG: adenylyltransferase/cytidyltransferase family protein, partial [Firmicutes bacterium]|nr:adenylyltransferase/cytidyltransferase family protein [Bacillota bacterium]